MEQSINEIIINNVAYIQKDTVKVMPKMTENYVVIRSDRAGVHVGELVSSTDTVHGKEVVLKNTRRIFYWSGAATLSQLALEGVKNPNNCKFTVEIPVNNIMGVIEIIPCSAEAVANIKGVPIWKS